MEKEKKIQLTIEANDTINYALYQNGTPLISAIRIQNLTGEDMENLVLRIKGDGDILIPYEETILQVRGGEELVIRSPKMSLQGSVLASLTERIQLGV